MSRRALSLFALLFFSSCASVSPPPPPAIVLDGQFDDWASVPSVPVVPPSSGVMRVNDVRMVEDSTYYYLELQLVSPVALQSMPATGRILLDLDGPSSGATRSGLTGVDLVIDFSPPEPKRPSAHSGVGIWRTGMPDGSIVSPYVLSLAHAPSIASRQFEVRFRKDNFQTRGTVRGRFLTLNGDGSDGAASAVWTARVIRGRDSSPEAASFLRTPSAELRVVSWNVASESIREHPEVFARILKAIDADIYILDEVTPALDVQAFLDRLGPGYHFTRGDGGGYQRSVVASRLPVSPAQALRRVDYRKEDAERMFTGFSADDRKKGLESLAVGIGTGGAFVEKDGRTLLVVPVDLWCCGPPDSWQEMRRIAEVGSIRSAVESAMREMQPQALIIGGDFNLVATADPLNELMRGFDVDHSDLSVAHPLHLAGATSFTWEAPPEDRFDPGRLDYVTFSDSSLQELRSFVFDTADLEESTLKESGLNRDDNVSVSDHRPVVVDFRWK